MNELPPTSGGPSIKADLTDTSRSESESRFNEKTVRKVDDRRSVPDLARESGDLMRDIRQRDTGHSSDSGSYHRQSVDSASTASSVLTDYEADFADFANADRITLNSDIRQPSDDFPVPVAANGASITISNGDADKPAVTADTSITIEGGGQLSKNSIKSLIKKLWNWAVNFASNHKIAIGLALSILFVFIMASPAGPAIVGGMLGATILASLGAVTACALLGCLIVDMIGKMTPYAQQVPAPAHQPNHHLPTPINPQTDSVDQNQQQVSEQASQSEPAPRRASPVPPCAAGKAESSDAVPRQKSDSIAEAEGQFFLTPIDKMSCTNAGVAAEPAKGSSVGTAAQAKPFSMAAFDGWLSENFARLSTRQQYAEFSKHLRKSDNYQVLDADGMLDRYLQELDQKSFDLSILANSPLMEPISSAALQQYNLQRFADVFESALEMLDPTPEHCRAMMTQLVSVLPKEEFPWISSDLWAPLLSVGAGRKSLEGISHDEMVQLEASDFLRLSLRILDRFANQRGAELVSSGDTGAEFTVSDTVVSDENQPRDDVSVVTEITSVDDNQESLAEEMGWSVLEQSILRRFTQLPGLQGFDTQLPDMPRSKVNFEAFFTNIVIAVVRWNERPESQSAEGKSARTSEHYQKLVVNSLARGVFAAGFRMMRDTPETIKIDTASGRKAFLGDLFESSEVDKIFADINAQEHEQANAREYLSGFIK